MPNSKPSPISCDKRDLSRTERAQPPCDPHKIDEIIARSSHKLRAFLCGKFALHALNEPQTAAVERATHRFGCAAHKAWRKNSGLFFKNWAFFRETGGLFFAYCPVCSCIEGSSSHAAVRSVCPCPLFAHRLTQSRECI